MTKAIFFDLDNTLIDFLVMKDKSCEAAIDAMVAAGLRIKKRKALKVLFDLYHEYGGLDHRQILQKLLKKLTGKVDYRFVAHGIVAYRKSRELYLTPYENVIPTLTKLKKKYKLGIISDTPRIKAWLRLVTLKIDHLFDVVITAADVRKKKKYAAPFKAALKALKVKPEEAVMVGDRMGRDIEIPNQLGMKTVYARYGNPRVKEGSYIGIKTFLKKQGAFSKVKEGKSGADLEIDDISELLRVFG